MMPNYVLKCQRHKFADDEHRFVTSERLRETDSGLPTNDACGFHK